MNPKHFDQIKSYSKLIVYELHKAIQDEAVFDKLKATLKLAEELECFVMEMERKQKEAPKSLAHLRLIA